MLLYIAVRFNANSGIVYNAG